MNKKIKLGMTLDNSLQMAEEKGGLDLQNSVMVKPDQVKKRSVIEKRSESKMTYLTKTELDKFLGLIGRKTFSDASRDLIIKFIKENEK